VISLNLTASGGRTGGKTASKKKPMTLKSGKRLEKNRLARNRPGSLWREIRRLCFLIVSRFEKLNVF
jgi:hypothetical protein